MCFGACARCERLFAVIPTSTALQRAPYYVENRFVTDQYVRIRRAEQGQNGRAGGQREVHEARIARYEQPRRMQDAGRLPDRRSPGQREADADLFIGVAEFNDPVAEVLDCPADGPPPGGRPALGWPGCARGDRDEPVADVVEVRGVPVLVVEARAGGGQGYPGEAGVVGEAVGVARAASEVDDAVGRGAAGVGGCGVGVVMQEVGVVAQDRHAAPGVAFAQGRINGQGHDFVPQPPPQVHADFTRSPAQGLNTPSDRAGGTCEDVIDAAGLIPGTWLI